MEFGFYGPSQVLQLSTITADAAGSKYRTEAVNEPRYRQLCNFYRLS